MKTIPVGRRELFLIASPNLLYCNTKTRCRVWQEKEYV